MYGFPQIILEFFSGIGLKLCFSCFERLVVSRYLVNLVTLVQLLANGGDVIAESRTTGRCEFWTIGPEAMVMWFVVTWV